MKNDNMKMDLQLFADASASLQNTTGTMTKEMKTFYEKRLIDQAEPRLVHDQFADYYPVPQNGGKTIEFRKYDSLPKADTPLTEGVTPNGQALNVTTITSDLHQYGGWTPLTDVLQMTAIDNNVVQATRVLASQAGRTMDSITRDVLAGGTNVIYAPKLGEDGTETAVTSRKTLDKSCTLTPKLFFQAAAQLGAMNADPIGDSYIAIIHPYAAYDLKTCKEFIEAHKYADPDTMYRGEIGKLATSALSRPARRRSGRTAPARRVWPCSVLWCWALTPTVSPSWKAAAGAHRQAAGLRRRPAEPARFRGLEGDACGGTSGGTVYGAY